MPLRHMQKTFPMHFYVTGFDVRSQISPESLYRDIADVRILFRVWIIWIAYLYLISEYLSIG